MQADSYNLGGLRTTLVVLLTSNPRLAGLPGNVLLPAAATGLPKDSVANVTQILTVDAGQLTEYVGDLPAKLMRKIEDGLRQVLDLG